MAGNLGLALYLKGQVEEAIECFRKVIALDPKDARAHTSLGSALAVKGQVEEAIACFRKAIAIDPKNALLLRPALAKAERMAAIQDRFAAFLKGEFKPTSNAERLGLAGWCKIKKRYRASAALHADCFAADATLAGDLKAAHRYDAACAAALAGAGQGADAGKLDDKERARLRKQALDWLKADLALRRKQMKSWLPGVPAQARAALLHWQKDNDLAGIRDKEALAKLPAEERAACAKLWADVVAPLKKAETAAKKEGKR
jgi:hypothetical protein